MANIIYDLAINLRLKSGSTLKETFKTEEERLSRYDYIKTRLNEDNNYFVEFSNSYINIDFIERVKIGAFQ